MGTDIITDVFNFTEWIALFKLENTNQLREGDIVFGVPNPIKKIGKENVIRRAWVSIITNDDAILLLDMDNDVMFIWDNNCQSNNDEYNVYVLKQ